ncbi:hypothetical protein QVD17_01521 [Tagetes erecta]|uniref:Uncharacterized protein n=1 Tax=Tagetes erecta TaxID=13708 RepID=A0AAD8P876_TARER|nr:hypothetical protein QVD17_01521 [Tagetes erecta]
MDAQELASLYQFHYQKLKKWHDDEDIHLTKPTPRKRSRLWRKFMVKKRFRIRVLGLRKLFRKRRKKCTKVINP